MRDGALNQQTPNFYRLRRPLVVVVACCTSVALAIPAHADSGQVGGSRPVPVAEAGENDDSYLIAKSEESSEEQRNFDPLEAIDTVGEWLLGERFVAAGGFSTWRMARSLSRTSTKNRYLRGALSGVVIDGASGKTLWRYNSGRNRLPASTQKVLTAFTVLRTISARTRLQTQAVQDVAQPWRIHLRGGGDPSLTPRRVRALAALTAVALKRQGLASVKVYGDTSYFKWGPPAPGWKPSYARTESQVPKSLTLAGYRRGDAPQTTTKIFATELARYSIRVTYSGLKNAPSSRKVLAATNSAAVGTMVQQMLSVSNNEYAEFLAWQAARAAGQPTSWVGVSRATMNALAKAGISTRGLRVADGSGLSRSNRMPVGVLATTLRYLWRTPGYSAIVFKKGAMPLAGRTGTLSKRFRSTAHRCARSRVMAKTGTLSDTIGLAGIANGVDRKTRIFVLLENGNAGRYTNVRNGVDTLATATVGCRL